MKQVFNIALIFLVLILSFTQLTCKEDNKESAKGNASIIGYDERMCPCCGGWVIQIDSVPNPNGGTSFLANNFPAGFDLGDKPVFPIRVQLEFQIDTGGCNGAFINITKIEKR
jgi:hypothetical protein